MIACITIFYKLPEIDNQFFTQITLKTWTVIHINTIKEKSDKCHANLPNFETFRRQPTIYPRIQVIKLKIWSIY